MIRLVIVGVACVAVGCGKPKSDSTGGTPAASGAPVAAAPAAEEKPIAVTADDLYAAYHKNEVSADDQYKGKIVRIAGQIRSIDKDAFNNIIVRLAVLDNQFQSIMATMQDAEKPKVKELSKGQIASLECKGGGMVIGNPVLKDCTLIRVKDVPPKR